MDNIKKNKFFLLISFKQIELKVLNENNETLFDNNFLVDDSTIEQNFKSLETFLDQNILNIEKKLNYYIKEIDLIIDYNNFLTIDVSTINSLNDFTIESDNVSNLLINMKDTVIKNIYDYDIIHMMINNFIIKGKKYDSIPSDKNYENLLLEIRFICLKKDILKNFEKILSKYEISLKEILCCDYVNHFKEYHSDNIFILADQLKNGLNQNEILFANKTNKNVGFFEKFFNLFG